MSEIFHIDTDFPGGNLIVDGVRGDEVDCHQDLRDSDRDWFYWCFRIRGAAGRKLKFNFTASRALGARGPAMSADGGRTWRWLGAQCVVGNAFTHAFAADEHDVRFSFAMPYQLADWQRFAAARPWLAVETLARTRGGRDVPLATLGGGETVILITARHHCCEMMPNYAIEGLIDDLHDSEEAAALRRRITLAVVPLVDLDGVEAGDQGKGRRPHDHNRDYSGTSLYPEIAALRRWCEARAPLVALDLHCPWLADSVIHLVGNPNPKIEAEQRRFSELLEASQRGPLPARASAFLPFGQSWNVAESYAAGMSCAQFTGSLPGTRLATTIELPYATADGREVNADTARQFGADLGRALVRYLA